MEDGNGSDERISHPRVFLSSDSGTVEAAAEEAEALSFSWWVWVTGAGGASASTVRSGDLHTWRWSVGVERTGESEASTHGGSVVPVVCCMSAESEAGGFFFLGMGFSRKVHGWAW